MRDSYICLGVIELKKSFSDNDDTYNEGYVYQQKVWAYTHVNQHYIRDSIYERTNGLS